MESIIYTKYNREKKDSRNSLQVFSVGIGEKFSITTHGSLRAERKFETVRLSFDKDEAQRIYNALKEMFQE